MSPPQFWRMHPLELWWLVEAKMPRKSLLPESEVAELRAFMQREGMLDG